MTDEHMTFPARTRQFGIDVLGNAVRVDGLTCATCTEPVDGHRLCWRCERHPQGLADLVMPLTYAVAGTPSAALVRDYKQHPHRPVRERCAGIVGVLTGLSIDLHASCIEWAARQTVTVRTTIPSLTWRPGVHPFAAALRGVGVEVEDVLRAGPDARCDRTVSRDKFVVAPGVDVSGGHVLLLDDVWTTGSNALSAALTLKEAGAAAVSVLVFSRWLNQEHPATGRFLRRRGHPSFDLAVCPVTGRHCE